MKLQFTSNKNVWAVLFIITTICAFVSQLVGASYAKDLTTVRIAYTKKGDYLPMVIALQKDYFAKYGIKVDEVLVTGGIEAAEAVTTGSADIGFMGEVPGIICATAQNPGTIIAAYVLDEKKHHLVIAPGSGIKKPKDLEGKRFAVQHGSSTYGGFLMYCDKYRVNVDKINMVKISPRDMPEAMASGQIDAMAGSNPWPSNVIKRNPKAKEFAVFSGLGCNYPMVMVATRDMQRSHPKSTTRVLQAIRDAISFIQSNPYESAALMSKQSGMASDTEKRDLERATWGLTLNKATVNGIKKMAHFLQKQDVIKREPKWSEAITRKFLPKDAKNGE